METFKYSNDMLLNILLWSMLALSLGYIVFAIIAGSAEEKKKWPWRVAWSVFTLAVVVIGIIMFVHADKQKATDVYSNNVLEYAKTTGQFDSVTGKVSFLPDQPGVLKVKVGDAEGQCLVAYPENKNDKLEFGCGSEFVPLDKAKEDLLKSAAEEEKAKAEATTKK